jgi:hypothetical protein
VREPGTSGAAEIEVRMAAIAYWGGLMIDDRGFWTRSVKPVNTC